MIQIQFCKPSTVVKWEYFNNYRNVKTSKKNPKNGWLNEDFSKHFFKTILRKKLLALFDNSTKLRPGLLRRVQSEER